MQDAADLFIDLDGIDPNVVFAKGGAGSLVSDIENAAREVAACPNIATATARGAIAAIAYKVARTKTALDEKGKAHVAYLKEQAKEVDAERKTIRDRLDALRDEVRKPLTDWEKAEDRRIEEHQQLLAEIEGAPTFDTPEPTLANIQDRIARVGTIGGNRDWQEFAGRAEKARENAFVKLERMAEAATRRETERAELEALRQREAENARRAEAAKIAEAATNRYRLEDAADIAAAKLRAENAVAEARQKLEAEQAEEKRAAQERANDRAHRAAVNSAARNCLMARTGLSSDLATAVIRAIALREIDHVTITY